MVKFISINIENNGGKVRRGEIRLFLHGSTQINNEGHLEIGGVDTVELVEKYGTPLYVYDVALIRKRARDFKKAFVEQNIQAQVAYASKAFSTTAMVQLVEEEGLSLDVVSGGELYTAIQANFPPEKIHFHGNNKSEAELIMALDYEIGCIVVDNFLELSMLKTLCEQREQTVKILLRVTPGIEAYTHDYIQTGQEDSKFGFGLDNGQAEQAAVKALDSPWLQLLGLHFHIGSQIFETTGYLIATEKLYEILALWKKKYNYEPSVVNLGGGFGIRYTAEDKPLQPADYVGQLIKEVKKQVERYGMKLPEIWIEPGRSLVGDAGTTLYKIGSSKIVPDIRKYVAVDGGMTDNIRPALYEAKYEAVLANRPLAKATETVSIAGRCCESGDMLIWDLPLPITNPGDILAVFCTGAYGYAMANNYNKIPRPAVVFVEDGVATLVVNRETYEDLVRLDLPLQQRVKR